MTSKFSTLVAALVVAAIGFNATLPTAQAGIITTPGLNRDRLLGV